MTLSSLTDLVRGTEEDGDSGGASGDRGGASGDRGGASGN